MIGQRSGIAIVLAAACVAVACEPHSAIDVDGWLKINGTAIHDNLKAPPHTPCTAARAPDQLSYLLMVGERQLNSCTNLGWLLRQSVRDGIGHFAVATTEEDLASVCDFLRTERAAVPLVLIPSHLFSGLPATAITLVGDGDPQRGPSLDVRFAVDAQGFLAILREGFPREDDADPSPTLPTGDNR